VLETPSTFAGQIVHCPNCHKAIRFPTRPPEIVARNPAPPSPKAKVAWFKRIPPGLRVPAVLFAFILLLALGSALYTQAGAPKWITISYAELLDKKSIVRTGQTLGLALSDDGQRAAVQPFVDRYSQLLPSALEFEEGPDQRAFHSVMDFFEPGLSQPAWAAIFQGGRIHIVTDDGNHAKVFLRGDDPQIAYDRNYSVIRHCLGLLCRRALVDLSVDVYAYQNDYARSELRLNARPYSFQAHDFPSHVTAIDLDALNAFFEQGPELQGAALKKGQGLVLYGTEGTKPTLHGEPVTLADLAVAYRAAFHAGDNEAFISLDLNKDPTKTTVNFGGFLENTRIGSVVLAADKRFKTITSGLDPDSSLDFRKYTRRFVPSFLSGAERELASGISAADNHWVGTRFWYYPDSIGIDSDLNWEYAVIINPRFTADAERSRDDFSSPDEFARKKKQTLSPSIRANIDNLNEHYEQYAQAYSEIAELTTVARLMGLCSWLHKAGPFWLDCDSLLNVELPPCQTETERTQLLAATCLWRSSDPAAEPHATEAQTFFLTPVLEQTVQQLFRSPANVVKYLSGESNPSPESRARFAAAADGLFSEHKYAKVQEIVRTKDDLQRLASYAADEVEAPRPSWVQDLKDRIATQKAQLVDLESAVDRMKRRLDSDEDVDSYNAQVDRYNGLVARYQRLQGECDADISRYNSLDLGVQHIVEIGGGIDLEPSKFAIRQIAASPSLREFERRMPKVRPDWTDTNDEQRWIKSAPSASLALGMRSPATGPNWFAPALLVKHWTRTVPRDGSWHSAVRVDGGHALGKSYDARLQQLQVAEFTNGQLQSLLVGRKDADGRIVFNRSARRDVLPPKDPPVWATPAAP